MTKSCMNYKLTLLKDLPNYPAGTQFYYRLTHAYSFFRDELIGMESYMGLTNNKYLNAGTLIPEEIIDNPEWVKKEIDYSTSLDLKCPICGETRGHIKVCGRRVGDKYDGFHNSADVFFEYDCGHELRRLYNGK